MRVGLICISILLVGLAACQKKKLPNGNKIGVEKNVFPNENTFFPLLEGSSWYYADYVAGERDPNSITRDSIVKCERNDTGYFVTVDRYSESSGSNDTLFYCVNKEGIVYKYLSKDDEPEIFALLNPKIGDKVGKKTYTAFCSNSLEDSGICIRLEEYPYDSAKTQIDKMRWQFFHFRKGIGIVANGGDELVTKLERYKIGNNPFKNY